MSRLGSVRPFSIGRLLVFLGSPLVWLGYLALAMLRIRPSRPKKTAKRDRRTAGISFEYDWLPLGLSGTRLLAEWQFAWRWRASNWRRNLPTIQPAQRPRVPSWVSFSFWSLVCLGVIVFTVYNALFADLPSPSGIRERSPIVSTKIYDRNGRLLYTIFKDENRTIVPLEEISPYLVSATLAIEDNEFYHHFGVSFKGIARALWHNLRNESTQGGSTITQQLVKNTLLNRERTWRRKIREAVLALAVDALYSKDEILYYYLNDVNYGGSVYGAQEASQWYFAKPAKELTLAESAFLAGLPVAPSAYSPFGTTPQLGFERQKEVLRRMRADNLITAEQLEQALGETLAFRNAAYDIKAPHFVMYVRSLLAQQFGEEIVSQGGLEVYTSLDLDVQASAEAALATELKRLERLKVGNGAALVTNPRSGEILAMVGSRDYFDNEHDGSVNVTIRPRQPGSSIKPITYALAFEQGWTPNSVIEDRPVVYTAPGSPPYAPKNYDGQFHGKVTLRQALASSYNVPAVRLLVDLGVPALVNQARELGISTWEDASRFGLSLTLGSGEVTMLDMAQVYGTFANQGETVPLNPILHVRQWDGRNLYLNPCASASRPCGGKPALSPLTAYEITSILSDNAARTPAFGPRSVLYIPGQEVAVKTGTTNSLRDNWTIGYVSDRVVLTWVGNNDNTPMHQVASGITGASPIWNTIMRSQLGNRSHAFAMPSGVEKVKVCRGTGTLPCQECPQVYEEVFLSGMAPTKHCSAAMFQQPPEGEDVKTAQR